MDTPASVAAPSASFLEEWSSLFTATNREQERSFRTVLTNVLHTGLWQCGIVGLVASLLYLGLSVLGLGHDLSWTYAAFDGVGDGSMDNRVVLVGVLIIFAMSVFSLTLSDLKCTLGTGRLFGGVAILIAAAVVTFEGALRGSFSTEYVVLAYLLVVTIVPFRPAQAAVLGVGVAVVMYGLGPTGPAWTGHVAIEATMMEHLLFVGSGAVLVTGASAILYRRHETFSAAEASLHRSREFLSRAEEVADMGGWEYAPQRGLVKGTEGLSSVLDVPAGGFTLTEWVSVFGASAQPTVREAIAACIDDGTPFDVEVPLESPDGTHRWARLRGSITHSDDGTTRVTGILQNITEQHEMRMHLWEQERLLRSITENVADGIYRLTPDDGLVYANRAFADLFGYDAIDALLDLDPQELYAAPTAQTQPLHVGNGTDSHEATFRRRDGTTFTGLLQGTVVRDPDGAVRHVDGVITDITGLKERENRLRGERDRYEVLFDEVIRDGA